MEVLPTHASVVSYGKEGCPHSMAANVLSSKYENVSSVMSSEPVLPEALAKLAGDHKTWPKVFGTKRDGTCEFIGGNSELQKLVPGQAGGAGNGGARLAGLVVVVFAASQLLV